MAEEFRSGEPSFIQTGTFAAVSSLSAGWNNTRLTVSGLSAYWGKVLSIITESTTGRVLSLNDIGRYIRFTHISGCQISIPLNASVLWSSQFYPPTLNFRIASTVMPTISTGGNTINNAALLSTLSQHKNFSLQWITVNTWDVIG